MASPPSIVVAGASSGIGAAVARRFLRAGWDVAAIGRRQARLDALLQDAGARGLALAADIGEPAQVELVAARLRQWRPHIDALVISAGDFLVAPIERTPAADFERIWRTTVLGKFLLTQALLPALAPPRGSPGDQRERPESGVEVPPAAVVHLASLAAHRDFTDETAYTSAMHAVRGLARAQDIELRPRGIRVCVVSPGLVRTELTERSAFTPADLAAALPPSAIADTIFALVEGVRAGSYIAEVLQLPAGID